MSDDWRRFVLEHGPAIYRIAWRILGNADDADEILQDAFLQAHQFESANNVDNRVGLLKRLTVCRALDLLRRRRGDLSLDDVTIANPESGPVAQAVGKELESRLREAIRQLPQREAEVFSLRYFDELSNQEIAETLNLKTAAVATALYKARTKLAGILADLIRESSR